MNKSKRPVVHRDKPGRTHFRGVESYRSEHKGAGGAPTDHSATGQHSRKFLLGKGTDIGAMAQSSISKMVGIADREETMVPQRSDDPTFDQHRAVYKACAGTTPTP